MPDHCDSVVHGDFASLFDRTARPGPSSPRDEFVRLADRTGIIGPYQRTLPNERLRDGANFLEFADEIARKIDNVRENVAERTGAGDLRLQTPDQRKIRIDNPILRIPCPKMKDAT